MFKKGDEVSTVLYGKYHIGTICALFDDDTCLIHTHHDVIHPIWRRPVRKLRTMLSELHRVIENDYE